MKTLHKIIYLFGLLLLPQFAFASDADFGYIIYTTFIRPVLLIIGFFALFYLVKRTKKMPEEWKNIQVVWTIKIILESIYIIFLSVLLNAILLDWLARYAHFYVHPFSIRGTIPYFFVILICYKWVTFLDTTKHSVFYQVLLFIFIGLLYIVPVIF